ncbi:GspH/FimT family pseudopilin [Agrobacterium sp. 22117]|uniref:GspH/FimT family pseudopilin n=1 Tax=Agrobacterium sp. 22117 TaxID=3453880 RepID=UPI003F862DDC
MRLEAIVQCQREAGFSLTEMLVVLGILGLVSSLIFPTFHVLTRTTPVSLGREVLHAATFARLAAIETGRSTQLTINTEERFVQASTAKGRIEIPDKISFDAVVGKDEKTTLKNGSITFYPGGGSSGGLIRFDRGGSSEVVVSVNWLTGSVTLQKVPTNERL